MAINIDIHVKFVKNIKIVRREYNKYLGAIVRQETGRFCGM